MSIFYNL